MESPPVITVQILKVNSVSPDNKSFSLNSSADQLAVERPLEISIIYGPDQQRQQKNISVTMCTPGHDADLAIGFLFTEGIIKEKEDVLHCKSHSGIQNSESNSVTVDLKPGVSFDTGKIGRHFYISSSCGVCGKSSIDAVKNNIMKTATGNNITVSAEILTGLPESLRKQQEIFAHTGGLHASALFTTDGNLLLTREDVGRHNALDKLIGVSLMSDMLPLNNHILLLSGRASFELIQKAAMADIKIVCAVGAPSSLAVDLAKECDMTLIGFLRDGRFNIYTGKQRITN